MIKFKTITPNKVIKTQKYLTHILDPINDWSGICGRKLSLDAYKTNFTVTYDETSITWLDRNICQKCLISLGVIEKLGSKKITTDSVISNTLESTTEIQTEYKTLRNLNLKHNTYKANTNIKNYEIF